MTTTALSRLFEGDFMGRIIRAEYGTSGRDNKPAARIVFEIAEGPRTGTQVTYQANFKQESIKYTKRDLLAAGWKGKTMASFVDDITARVGTTVPINVRIASYQNRDTGKTQEWNSVGSIGNTAPPLAAPTADLTRNVDSWFAEVDDGNGNGSHPNAPGSSYDKDIPF